jgi:hypothetical protein
MVMSIQQLQHQNAEKRSNTNVIVEDFFVGASKERHGTMPQKALNSNCIIHMN